MKLSPGDLDRHITVEVATESKDGPGDVIQTWSEFCKLWAGKREQRGRETAYTQQTIRDFDTVFTVRAGTKAKQIAPESHRIVHKGQLFEIVGVQETAEREDGLDILAASRPDHRGARGPVAESGVT